jgi:predicted nucleic acid-binding protein
MITAVDTSVLIDVLGPDPDHGPRAAQALRTCLREGRLVACEVVWAEIAGQFRTSGEAGDALARARIDFDAIDRESALRAGAAWREYRRQGGRRDRVVADFLIGAHARLRADRLITRDRGFYRAYFAGLKILDPSATAP